MEKIEITRETLRQAFRKVYAVNTELWLEPLEFEIFGPSKPREWSLFIAPNGEAYTHINSVSAIAWPRVRVREIIDGE